MEKKEQKLENKQVELELKVPQVVENVVAAPPTNEVAAPPTNVVAKKPLTAIQRFQSNLDAYANNILPSLLKKHNIDPEQFKFIVLSEIKKNDKLLEAFVANPSSMFASILAGAEIGLIPSDMIGEFFLIPRKIKEKLVVTPQIGYKGLHAVLLRSGDITKIHTECVFEGDEFEAIYGLEQNIIHKPNFNAVRNSKTLKFVYAVAKLKNAEYQFTVLSKGDIIKIKEMSPYNNELYFNDAKDPNNWMVRKTTLIQLAKMLPKDYYGKKAVDLDNKLEGGAMLMLDENNEVKIVDGTKIVTSKYASVKNTLNSLPEIPE